MFNAQGWQPWSLDDQSVLEHGVYLGGFEDFKDASHEKKKIENLRWGFRQRGPKPYILGATITSSAGSEKSVQLRTHFKAFMNPAEIFSEVGKKIFNKTLKKMFENEVHCFLTTQCFQLLNCIESHRIASNRIVLNRFLSTCIFSCIVSCPCIEIRIGSSLSWEIYTPRTYASWNSEKDLQ